MATNGKRREETISALLAHVPFKRSGFHMWAVQGAHYETGRMPALARDQYRFHANANNIKYTVVSYGTPIAYVLESGMVIVPDETYSRTTSAHQTLCRNFL